MSVRKKIRELGAVVKSYTKDFTITQTGGSHLKVTVTGPLGVGIVTASLSASDHREMLNFKRDLRHAVNDAGIA